MFQLNNLKKKENQIIKFDFVFDTNISFICSNDVGLRISIILIIFKKKEKTNEEEISFY